MKKNISAKNRIGRNQKVIGNKPVEFPPSKNNVFMLREKLRVVNVPIKILNTIFIAINE